MIKDENELLELTKSDSTLASSEIKYSDLNNTTTVLIEEL